MILLISVIVLTLVLLYYHATRMRNYWTHKNVKGPKPIPFFGNCIESLLRIKNLGVIYKQIYDEFPNESVIGFHRMTTPTLMVRDLDLIKQILVKDFDAFPERGVEFSKEGLGDNLFHSDEKTWRELRSRLTTIFTPKNLRAVFPVIEYHADQLVKYLKTVSYEAPEQRLEEHMEKYAMSTTLAAAFDLHIDFFGDNQTVITNVGRGIFKSSYTFDIDNVFPNILKKMNCSLYSGLINQFCYKVIQEAINKKKREPTGRNDLVDTLLALKKTNEVKRTNPLCDTEDVIDITEHVMAGQVLIFFAAGFGNNAHLLSYTLFELAKHKDYQDKLIQEINEILLRYDGQLTFEALREMTYLEMVFSEILRMHPMNLTLQRSAKKEFKIPGTEVVIDKGTSILISTYSLHRDEKLYPDPDKFDPERFSSENTAKRHPFAYLPFGAGPRSCLGRQLGKLQYSVAMVKILSQFRVEPSDRTTKVEEYDPMTNIWSTRGGIYVNIIPRQD